MSGYEFTTDWFSDQVRSHFAGVFQLVQPAKVLEIGCFEGAATCHLIEHLGQLDRGEVHCIDTWQGSAEYAEQSFTDTYDIDMVDVEQRFLRNTQKALASVSERVQLTVHKGRSIDMLARLICEQQQFDFIYIDASHQAPDVLSDAVMAFEILKPGGVLGFDDYLWFEEFGYGKNVLRSPKIAIDAFTNIYANSLEFLRSRSDQVYARKN